MSSYEGDGPSNFMNASYQQPEYVAGSYTGEQTLYGPEDSSDLVPGFASDQKPKILLMGLRRSGKSSIQNVVFHKMSPNETVFLESTNKITTNDISNATVVQFKILDFPGQIDFFDPAFNSAKIFGGVGALVFVIDAQDDYLDAVARLGETVSRVYKINPDLKFEVFIHKVDGLTDDTKIETQRDIHQKACDDLQEYSLGIPGLENVLLNFYLTSIYDHSIFEAFSKVVQKLIPQLPTLENLLTIFNSNSSIEKSFLFDVSSKIYIATDYSPVDMQSYELCCDMIDVVLDISYIYGVDEESSDNMAGFDPHTCSVIKLNNNTVLLMWQVAPFLALVCILREENYNRPGLIEYNYQCFRKGLLDIFEVRNHYLKIEQQQYEQKLRKLQLAQQEQDDTLNSAAISDTISSIEKKLSLNPISSTPLKSGEPESNNTLQSGALNPSNSGNQTHAEGQGSSKAQGFLSDNAFKRNSTDGASASSVAVSRTLSDGLSSRVTNTDHRAQLRHASAAVGETHAPLVRELVTGQFIKSGGPDNIITSAEVAVGNTYVMTDDDGMVLINGSTSNGTVRS